MKLSVLKLLLLLRNLTFILQRPRNSPVINDQAKKKKKKMKALLVGVLLCVGLAHAIPPVAWPPVHTHVEIEFSLDMSGVTQIKKFQYDYTQLSMRVDSTYLTGPSIFKIVNLTSWWINDTLTILTFIGEIPTCTQLQMGFGMPVPDWFTFGAETMQPGLWLTRQYNKSDPWYYRTLWTRKSAMPDGYFNYFSFNDTGLPFRMSAPSPAGEVLNEYYDFAEVASFPAGTFAAPAKCVLTAAVPRHASESLTAFGAMMQQHTAKMGLTEEAAAVMTSHASQLLLMAKARN
jgi:hypothetical protein